MGTMGTGLTQEALALGRRHMRWLKTYRRNTPRRMCALLGKVQGIRENNLAIQLNVGKAVNARDVSKAGDGINDDGSTNG